MLATREMTSSKFEIKNTVIGNMHAGSYRNHYTASMVMALLIFMSYHVFVLRSVQTKSRFKLKHTGNM